MNHKRSQRRSKKRFSSGKTHVYKILDVEDSITVKVNNNNVQIYENKNLIKTYKPLQIFIGKSELDNITRFSGAFGNKYNGNTILIKISFGYQENMSESEFILSKMNYHGDIAHNIMSYLHDNYLKQPQHKYIYIGSSIKSFEFNEIVKYVSPVGNNEVPYPYAIDKYNNVILFQDNIVLTKWTDKIDFDNSDPYTTYYGHDMYWYNMLNKDFFKKYNVKNFFFKYEDDEDDEDDEDYEELLLKFNNNNMFRYDEDDEDDDDENDEDDENDDDENDENDEDEDEDVINNHKVFMYKTPSHLKYNNLYNNLYKTNFDDSIERIITPIAHQILLDYKDYLGIRDLKTKKMR
jgi:hypothetical protein